MNTPAPLSYLFDFLSYPEAVRKCRLQEFAVHGVRHLVLSSPLLKHLIAYPDRVGMFAGELAAAGLSFGDAHAPYGMHWDLLCVFEEERPALFVRQKMALNIAAQSITDWENPEVIGLNKENYHTTLTLPSTKSECKEIISLNGLWSFNWAKNPDERPVNFYEENFDISKWDKRSYI